MATFIGGRAADAWKKGLIAEPGFSAANEARASPGMSRPAAARELPLPAARLSLAREAQEKFRRPQGVRAD